MERQRSANRTPHIAGSKLKNIRRSDLENLRHLISRTRSSEGQALEDGHKSQLWAYHLWYDSAFQQHRSCTTTQWVLKTRAAEGVLKTSAEVLVFFCKTRVFRHVIDLCPKHKRRIFKTLKVRTCVGMMCEISSSESFLRQDVFPALSSPRSSKRTFAINNKNIQMRFEWTVQRLYLSQTLWSDRFRFSVCLRDCSELWFRSNKGGVSNRQLYL